MNNESDFIKEVYGQRQDQPPKRKRLKPKPPAKRKTRSTKDSKQKKY